MGSQNHSKTTENIDLHFATYQTICIVSGFKIIDTYTLGISSICAYNITDKFRNTIF